MKNENVRSFFAPKQGSAWMAFAVIIFGSLAYADDLPAFRKGMWEFNRTIQEPASSKPQTITDRRCVNPGDDMKKQNEMLTKMGCKFSPMKRDGTTYTFTADCTMNAGGRSITSKTTSTITVESDSAYSIQVKGETDGQVTSETLTAKRTGDCN